MSISNLPICIFFLDKRSQFWLDACKVIAELHPDEQLVIVDTGHYEYPPQAPWRVADSDTGRLNSPKEIFASFGVIYFDAIEFEMQKPDPTSFPNLEIEVLSTLISATKAPLRENQNLSPLKNLIRWWIRKKAQRAFIASKNAIESLSPARVIIMNGRFAHQKASLYAATEKNLEVTFAEVNSIMNNLFLRAYRIQDRIASQKDAMDKDFENAELNLSSIHQRYFQLQMSKSSPSNPFNRLWDEDGLGVGDQIEELALFATSSRDEFDSLGLQWKEASWKSQLEAFSAIWAKLEESEPSLKPVLRIHPNLINKSPISALRELSEVRDFTKRHPQFIVYGPTSPVSTYSLVQKSKVVIVQNSSLGLEAQALGKSVICTNSSAYDLVLPVTKVHHPSDLVRVENILGPDSVRALKFIGLQENLDYKVVANSSNVVLTQSATLRRIFASVARGVLFSMVYELRWKAYRYLLKATT